MVIFGSKTHIQDMQLLVSPMKAILGKNVSIVSTGSLMQNPHTIKQSKVVYREIENSFICYSSNCPSVRNCCNASLKDKLSALCYSNKLPLLSQ